MMSGDGLIIAGLAMVAINWLILGKASRNEVMKTVEPRQHKAPVGGEEPTCRTK